MPHPQPRRIPRAPKKGIAANVKEAFPAATEEDVLRVSRNIHRRLREQKERTNG